MDISPNELVKIQAFLRSKFGNEGIAVRPRSQTGDSIEVLINGEFIGLVYKDEDDGDVSYLSLIHISEPTRPY